MTIGINNMADLDESRTALRLSALDLHPSVLYYWSTLSVDMLPFNVLDAPDTHTARRVVGRRLKKRNLSIVPF
jgi:hypothetical protein